MYIMIHEQGPEAVGRCGQSWQPQKFDTNQICHNTFMSSCLNVRAVPFPDAVTLDVA
jgi:hypothetical protein